MQRLSKKDAKRWACDLAATLLIEDIANGILDEDDADHVLRAEAMKKLAAELQRKAGDVTGLYSDIAKPFKW